MKSFAYAFDPSKRAAFLSGPNIFNPFSWNLSTMPSTRSSSLPTIVRSIFSFTANAKSSSIPFIFTFSPFGSVAVPPLPGAQKTFSTFLFWLTFQQIACSLPPLPTTNNFIL